MLQAMISLPCKLHCLGSLDPYLTGSISEKRRKEGPATITAPLPSSYAFGDVIRGIYKYDTKMRNDSVVNEPEVGNSR